MGERLADNNQDEGQSIKRQYDSSKIIRSKSGGYTSHRGKHRSQNKGKGIAAFFRHLWYKRNRGRDERSTPHNISD